MEHTSKAQQTFIPFATLEDEIPEAATALQARVEKYSGTLLDIRRCSGRGQRTWYRARVYVPYPYQSGGEVQGWWWAYDVERWRWDGARKPRKHPESHISESTLARINPLAAEALVSRKLLRGARLYEIYRTPGARIRAIVQLPDGTYETWKLTHTPGYHPSWDILVRGLS